MIELIFVVYWIIIAFSMGRDYERHQVEIEKEKEEITLDGYTVIYDENGNMIYAYK